jgi:general secretion pathway protein K
MQGAHRPRTRGMVLIAVLWIVAAISLVVVGMVHSVRQEARMLSTTRALALAAGVGEAAVHLALRQLAAQNTPPSRMLTWQVAYRQTPVAVRVMPLNGLIDLNAAQAPLLAAMYEVGGGRSRDEAQALAQQTIALRTPSSPGTNAERFEATEDLLRVPGVDFDLYARVAPLVATDAGGGGSGGVNALAAPVEVLQVLAGGGHAIASRIAAARDAGEAGVDTTDLTAAFLEGGSVQRYRVEARVPLPDGAWLHVARQVDMSGDVPERLPWRTLHTEQWVTPAPRTGS